MKKLLVLSLILLTCNINAQYSQTSGLYFAKEFSKDAALYKAKSYVMTQILGVDENLVKFDIDPLAAASSGELTSLVYNCEQKNINGLILGFYGNRWNESGVSYQAYAFKNFEKERAFELFEILEEYFDNETEYISTFNKENNMYFKFDDLTFLIYNDGGKKIRVFWEGFDSEWEYTAYKRTRRRFEKRVD
ncbi:hypothetical protein G3567_02615 [Psychroflexus sp. YR1-1]|uniref:Uncharacterized protein n=1 Tax=Psychroflexus aurantiacus TaxID=2709310 RepID=A0A6B3QY47_9FLAO|nr:hypothetical protein [Psychroflexus aurantiacus]NEV93039.1 hypothetical protein [Psychroflexus aurantiacus]